MKQFIIRKLGEPSHNKIAPHGHPANNDPNSHNNIHTAEKTSPSRSPMHYFFFLLSGTVLVEIGEKTYFIKEHNLVVIPSGQMFSIRYFENPEGYMGGFTTQFASGLNSAENILSKHDFLRIWGSPKIELSPKDFSRQLILFERIYEEFSCNAPNNEIIKAYLCTILAEADAIYRQTEQKVQISSNKICNRFLDELFNGDEKHPKLTVNEYAYMLNISPNHLNKVVKATTGKSPSAWIEEAIILKAKLLLKCTTLPMNEIAARTGILDQSYFARKFRQHEGITPSEYRHRTKGEGSRYNND